MTTTAVEASAGTTDRGARMYELIKELYPICRSITGRGVRDTLAILKRSIPLAIAEVPSGKAVFDWQVPDEWSIRDAYIKNSSGERIVDFKKCNLHVINYSRPVRRHMTLAELRPHLHSLPDNPDWIPYRTAYYRDTWGFCVTHRFLERLADDTYEVCVDSELKPGSLTFAELILPGQSPAEVVVYSHTCHPSLCNDNLSALAVATLLAESVARRPRRLTYRFIFGPTTIGSITWLALHESHVDRIRHGLILASLGDRGGLVYKRSRRGNAEVDRVIEYVITRSHGGRCVDFSPYGYDERQFCSPGFNLPVGRLTRTPNGQYPEYHTSADNLDFISPQALERSLQACEAICVALELNARFLNLSPKCEPRLGARGLYQNITGRNPSEFEHALLWVLNQSDGTQDLLQVAIKSGLDLTLIAQAAQALEEAGLLGRCSD